MAPISRGLSLVSVLESVWLSAALGISFPMHSLPRSPEGAQGHSPLLQSPAASSSCSSQAGKFPPATLPKAPRQC